VNNICFFLRACQAYRIPAVFLTYAFLCLSFFPGWKHHQHNFLSLVPVICYAEARHLVKNHSFLCFKKIGIFQLCNLKLRPGLPKLVITNLTSGCKENKSSDVSWCFFSLHLVSELVRFPATACSRTIALLSMQKESGIQCARSQRRTSHNTTHNCNKNTLQKSKF